MQVLYLIIYCNLTVQITEQQLTNRTRKKPSIASWTQQNTNMDAFDIVWCKLRESGGGHNVTRTAACMRNLPCISAQAHVVHGS